MNRTSKTTKTASKGATGKQLGEASKALEPMITMEDHPHWVDYLPSAPDLYKRIEEDTSVIADEGEKQAEAERLMREAINRIANYEQALSSHVKIEEAKSVHVTANTMREKVEAGMQYQAALNEAVSKLYSPSSDSLEAILLSMASQTRMLAWLISIAQENFAEEHQDLAVTVISALIDFGREGELKHLPMIVHRILPREFEDYVNAEFPCELIEADDFAEVAEGGRPPGRSPTFDARKATDQYLDLWTSRRPGERYASNDVDRELVKQVMREMKIAAIELTVRRAIRDEIAYRMGEDVYPLKITLTLYKPQMAAVSALARKKGHTAKLSPKETVRAALGLKHARKPKRT